MMMMMEPIHPSIHPLSPPTTYPGDFISKSSMNVYCYCYFFSFYFTLLYFILLLFILLYVPHQADLDDSVRNE